MVASSNNVATDVRTSFPTPSGNPTVGAGLQEFRALVRKQGGTGTPTARIELWQAGALVRAGSNTGVTSTSGVVHSLTWNANEIAAADGSAVECKLVGTQSGGSPSVRASIDMGAVEWNVTYTIAGAALEGAAVGQASAAGALTTQIRLAAAVAAAMSASGGLGPGLALAGSTAAEASASGDLTTSTPLEGAAVAEASAAGALVTGIPLLGATLTVTSAAGDLTIEKPLEGAAVVQASAAG